MKIIYSKNYNFHLGPLKYFHPFDGEKFARIAKDIQSSVGSNIIAPENEASAKIIQPFLGELLKLLLVEPKYILRALEAPSIPFLTMNFLDKKILTPMRWSISGTLLGSSLALRNSINSWNLSGGYHHASPKSAEGFCIYNDIGITVKHLRDTQQLQPDDDILIIDIDAHHGNGNANTFYDDPSVFIVDIYNRDIYPQRPSSRERVNIGMPLRHHTEGPAYLKALKEGLDAIPAKPYRLAYVVAGTDVLATDPLGGLCLSIDDCVARDAMVLDALARLNTPAVFLGGGGYGKDSAAAVVASITANHDRNPGVLGADQSG